MGKETGVKLRQLNEASGVWCLSLRLRAQHPSAHSRDQHQKRGQELGTGHPSPPPATWSHQAALLMYDGTTGVTRISPSTAVSPIEY